MMRLPRNAKQARQGSGGPLYWCFDQLAQIAYAVTDGGLPVAVCWTSVAVAVHTVAPLGKVAV
ncbi:MAG: hypothetical protein QOI51_2449, partial [Nocardioidaceae bacterium]|nr:hypothetical protein [Nocardioidaceae bacterium]